MSSRLNLYLWSLIYQLGVKFTSSQDKKHRVYLDNNFLHCHGATQWFVGLCFGFQGD